MAEAKVIIKSENNISKGINSAKKDLQGFGSFTEQLGSTLTKAFAATAIIAGIKKIVDGCKELINEYAEAEKVALRLQKVWDNVGAATGKSYDEIMKYADALEKSTYFTSEAVEESALLLAATESLTEDGFERALNVSADLAAAMGEDITQAASTLAKALQEPEAALSRLKTVGVSFTDEEKEQIKALTDANQLYEAQDIILDKIEQKYKDVAKAINNTPAGTLDNIKDTLQDIRENLGGALLDVISPALELVYKALLKISEWVAKARAKAAEVKQMNEVTSTLKAGGSLESFSDELLYQAIEGYTEAMNSGVYEFKAHADWYANAIETINKELAERQEKAMEDFHIEVSPVIIKGIDDSTQTIIDNTVNAFDKFFKSYGTSSKGYLADTYQAVIDEAQEFMDIISKGTYLEEDGSIPAIAQLGLSEDTTIDDLRKMYEQLSEVVETYTNKIADLNNTEEEDPFKDILSKYGSLSKAFQIDSLNSEIKKLTDLRSKADDETGAYLDEIIEALFEQLESLNKIEEEVKEPKSFIDTFTDKLKDFLNPFGESGTTWTAFGKDFFKVDDEQAGAAANALVGKTVSSLGEAGELMANLAQNMATMGPILGAIVTALQYVIEGFAEVIGPELEEFVKNGLEPLREIGRVIADILLPIFEDLGPLVEESANFLIGLFDAIGAVLKPIVSFISSLLVPVLDGLVAILNILEVPLKLVAKGLSAVGETLGWLGDWIRHIVATIVNWLASWIPWMDGMTDPGKPGNLGDRIQTSWDKIDAAFNGDSLGTSTSTDTAMRNASYSGATSVTINIYQEAPVVGDGGMLQFAQMIRDQFENLAYYSV